MYSEQALKYSNRNVR